MCRGWRGAPVRLGVAHRQRGGTNALIRPGSGEKRRFGFGSAAVTGSSGGYRLPRSLFADAGFTDDRVHMFTRAALLRDKSAVQSRPRPAWMSVQGCNRRGHPGKNQNSGVTDERDLFIEAAAVVSMTPDTSGAPPDWCWSSVAVLFSQQTRVGWPHLSC